MGWTKYTLARSATQSGSGTTPHRSRVLGPNTPHAWFRLLCWGKIQFNTTTHTHTQHTQRIALKMDVEHTEKRFSVLHVTLPYFLIWWLKSDFQSCQLNSHILLLHWKSLFSVLNIHRLFSYYITENRFSVFWMQETRNGTQDATGKHRIVPNHWKALFSVLDAGDKKSPPGCNGEH